MEKTATASICGHEVPTWQAAWSHCWECAKKLEAERREYADGAADLRRARQRRESRDSSRHNNE